MLGKVSATAIAVDVTKRLSVIMPSPFFARRGAAARYEQNDTKEFLFLSKILSTLIVCEACTLTAPRLSKVGWQSGQLTIHTEPSRHYARFVFSRAGLLGASSPKPGSATAEAPLRCQ